MTTAVPEAPIGGPGAKVRVTAQFVVRQLLALLVIGTLLLLMVFFINFYNIPALQGPTFFFDWPNVCYKAVCAPAIVVLVYGYVLLIGALFALVPSERSFNLFFYGILAALAVVNYDHTVIDWVLRTVFAGSLTTPNPVSVIKVGIAAALLAMVLVLHYNILADDFTKRMIRRGIPTEEAARIRPGMFKALVPLFTVCGVAAVGLAVVGEFSALVFQDHGLFPKIEILLLGIFGVVIAYILRSIIKELYQGGGDDEETPPTRGPE